MPKKKKTKRFAPKLDKIQEELEREEPEKESDDWDGTIEMPLVDPRLDKVVPLLVDMLVKLLSVSGLARYRLDLVKQIKEIMEEDGGEKDTS